MPFQLALNLSAFADRQLFLFLSVNHLENILQLDHTFFSSLWHVHWISKCTFGRSARTNADRPEDWALPIL